MSLFKNFFSKKPKHYLSLLSPVKDEEDYMVEFVEYYLLHGVEHFYFYDNESKIPLKETLKNYLDVCTIIEFPGDAIQYKSYEHWLNNFRDETFWIAVFDIDEFVVPHRHFTFVEYLKNNEQFDSIAINWLGFGSKPHTKKPKGLVIENYQFSEGRQHPNFKCVSKAKCIQKLIHCHLPSLKKAYSVVNPKGEIVNELQNLSYCHDIIQLNHYFTKSEEEYLKKINRKRADSGKSRVDHTEDHSWLFDAHLAPNTINTQIIDKYLVTLKKNIKTK